MPEDTFREKEEWHRVWHKRYLTSEIEAFLKSGKPSLQETVKTIKIYLNSEYVQKIDLRNIFIDIATSTSFVWDEDSRIRFKLLKNEFRDII